MTINPLQISAYAREISRASRETGKVVDVSTSQGEMVSPATAHGPTAQPEAGSIPGVLTPEESRWIADLFPPKEGTVEARTPGAYSLAGRTVDLPASRGMRLDMKG